MRNKTEIRKETFMLLPLACLFYGVIIVTALLRPQSVTFNKRPINPLLRVIIAPIVFLVIGAVLTLAGYIGMFLLLPVVDLF
jgi:hypothetical protein